MSLKSLKLPNNSEVLVASNSYIACILSILNAGPNQFLLSQTWRTYNIDPKKFQKKFQKKNQSNFSSSFVW